MIIDTHAHYDDEKYDEDREELLASFWAGGVSKVINMGTRIETSLSTVELAKTHENVYAAVGIHPEELEGLVPDYISVLWGLTAEKKVVMIGEIGLDYYWDKDHKEEQKKVFREQLQLAARLGLPVSIHSREAAEDTINILEEEVAAATAKGHRLTGILHCYGYSTEMAKRFISLGFLLGIGGVCTFKNSKKLKETIKEIPLEKLVLETDAPYLAPEPYRGKRNSSLYIDFVAAAIADLKGIEKAEVLAKTEENALKLIPGLSAG